MFDTETDAKFQEILKITKSKTSVIWVDDFIRLIDCRDYQSALEQTHYLLNTVRVIYWAKRQALLRELDLDEIGYAVAQATNAASIKSKRIKAGLKKNAEFISGPSKKVARAGADARKASAIKRAIQLAPSIDGLRKQMPPETRQNLSAVAVALNEAQLPTPSRRGKWQGTMVKRVLQRAAE